VPDLDLFYKGNGRFETSDGDDRIRRHGDYEIVVAPAALLSRLTVAAIEAALNHAQEEKDIEALAWWITPDEDPHGMYNPDLEEDFRIDYSEDEAVAITVPLGEYVDEGDGRHLDLEAAFRAFTRRTGTSFSFYELDPYTGTDVSVVQLEVDSRTSGDELLTIAREAAALSKATAGGGLSLARSADLVKGGLIRPLLGQPECAWLDGKVAPYRLTTVPEKLELAKDVAAFANAEGGLIVVGVKTERGTDGDLLVDESRFPLELMGVQQCRDIVRDRVFPAVAGMDVGSRELEDGRGIGYIHVPPQPPERKPFLVRGAVVEGRVRSTTMAIPTRDGPDTRWADVAEVHALLQAGRVALARVARDAG
jgi:hypothetical protein